MDLPSPDMNKYVFAEILMNQHQMRFGVNVEVSNAGEGMGVVPAGTVLYVQYGKLKECFGNKMYRLI